MYLVIVTWYVLAQVLTVTDKKIPCAATVDLLVVYQRREGSLSPLSLMVGLAS
jgi:hypothetical protein